MTKTTKTAKLQNVTTKTVKANFYAKRAAKIATARAANKATGFSVRALRAIAREDRAFLASVAGL